MASNSVTAAYKKIAFVVEATFPYRGGRINMKRKSQYNRRPGFSLLEVIAAVVVLAVVAAATVAAIAPMREKSRQKLDEHNISQLNAIVQAYYMEMGRWPDTNLVRLQRDGYADERRHPTPYGGFYTFDATTQKVVNLNRP